MAERESNRGVGTAVWFAFDPRSVIWTDKATLGSQVLDPVWSRMSMSSILSANHDNRVPLEADISERRRRKKNDRHRTPQSAWPSGRASWMPARHCSRSSIETVALSAHGGSGRAIPSMVMRICEWSAVNGKLKAGKNCGMPDRLLMGDWQMGPCGPDWKAWIAYASKAATALLASMCRSQRSIPFEAAHLCQRFKAEKYLPRVDLATKLTRRCLATSYPVRMSQRWSAPVSIQLLVSQIACVESGRELYVSPGPQPC